MVLNVPKPAMETVSPAARASAMVEHMTLKAVSASVLDMEAASATRAESSDLFIPVFSGQRMGIDDSRRFRFVSSLSQQGAVLPRGSRAPGNGTGCIAVGHPMDGRRGIGDGSCRPRCGGPIRFRAMGSVGPQARRPSAVSRTIASSRRKGGRSSAERRATNPER